MLYILSMEKLSEKLPKEYQGQMKELLGDVKVDEQRLLTETAIFADKIAVAPDKEIKVRKKGLMTKEPKIAFLENETIYIEQVSKTVLNEIKL